MKAFIVGGYGVGGGVGLDSWEGGGQVVNTTMVLWFAEMGEGDKQ